MSQVCLTDIVCFVWSIIEYVDCFYIGKDTCFSDFLYVTEEKNYKLFSFQEPAYNPQVEAISPTLPSEELSNVKSTKDEVLQQINKADREIGIAEQTITKLKKKLVRVLNDNTWQKTKVFTQILKYNTQKSNILAK